MKRMISILTLAIPLLLFACSEQGSTAAPQVQEPIEAAQKAAEQSDANLGALTYQSTCASCHDSGVAGAPKIGDTEAWLAHRDHDMAHMLEAVRAGKGAMPPRGGNPKLSDAELRAAIEYILKQSL